MQYEPEFLSLLKKDANKAVESLRGILALTKTKLKLKTVLTEIFGGDALAAEFTIFNLISRVHARKDPPSHFGQFPAEHIESSEERVGGRSGPVRKLHRNTDGNKQRIRKKSARVLQVIRSMLERTCTVEVTLGMLEKADLVPLPSPFPIKIMKITRSKTPRCSWPTRHIC